MPRPPLRVLGFHSTPYEKPISRGGVGGMRGVGKSPKCGASIKVIAFITDFGAVDRIIDHLKLTFVAEKPPPSHVFEQVALMAAEERAEYF